jgi:tRNA nucleotidyltransferase (CCA-adding enzyme)
METYLVGGAVRDQLLGAPVTERDWVVIGETPESMLAQGFRAVGKDFPVFLHPGSHEEYALARTERKTAPGYKGFQIYASPDVTLQQDLIRRDLTINAMAMATDGQLLDPYGGKNDLDKKILRHISPAFAEDPVRILRVARFAARYWHLGFTVAIETRDLMAAMVASGEVDHLVPERIWAELVKALSEKTPGAFFQTLRSCGALARIFPEIDQLFGVPQPEAHHPEIDTGEHILLCLEQAVRLSERLDVRFAVLVHDLGKGVTPQDQWPHHYGHERTGVVLLDRLCARLRVPNAYKSLAHIVMRYHTHCHKALSLRPGTLIDFLNALGAFKPGGGLLEPFLLACEADARGRTGLENRAYPQRDFMLAVAKAAATADTSAVMAKDLKGAQIGEAIRHIRIKVVAEVIHARRNNAL